MRRGMKGFLTELTDGEENEESRKRVETKGVGTEEEITRLISFGMILRYELKNISQLKYLYFIRLNAHSIQP